MTAATIHTPPTRTPGKRAPRYLQIAAWSIPVMMIGQFAMLAIAPVLVVLLGALIDVRARYLRWWAVAVAAVYAVPLVIRFVRVDPAPSLSKDIHPGLLAAVVVVAAALLVRLYLGRRR